MRSITAEYELDLGVLGRRDVFVVGSAERLVTGSIRAEIKEVWVILSVRDVDQKVNLVSEIKERDLEAIRIRLISAYIADRYRGIEGCV